MKNILPEENKPQFFLTDSSGATSTRPRLLFSETEDRFNQKMRTHWFTKFKKDTFKEIFQIKDIDENKKEITLKSADAKLSPSEVLRIYKNKQLTPKELQNVQKIINSKGLKYVKEKEKCQVQGNYCLENQPEVLNIISIHVNTTIEPHIEEIKKILPGDHRIELQHPLKT